MKQLMNSNLFSLLKNQYENKRNKSNLEEAYEEFAEKLLDKLRTELDITELYYNLGFVRLELVGIRDSLFGKEGKKCLKYYN